MLLLEATRHSLPLIDGFNIVIVFILELGCRDLGIPLDDLNMLARGNVALEYLL